MQVSNAWVFFYEILRKSTNPVRLPNNGEAGRFWI